MREPDLHSIYARKQSAWLFRRLLQARVVEDRMALIHVHVESVDYTDIRHRHTYIFSFRKRA